MALLATAVPADNILCLLGTLRVPMLLLITCQEAILGQEGLFMGLLYFLRLDFYLLRLEQVLRQPRFSKVQLLE